MLRRTSDRTRRQRLVAPPARARGDPSRGKLCGDRLAAASDRRRDVRTAGRPPVGDGVADRHRHPGLPVAVALAWFYEAGDGGVARDTAAAGVSRPVVHGLRRYADLAIIGALLATVAVLLVRQSDLGPSGAKGMAIAVLPFRNLSTAPNGEVLASGIAESIRTSSPTFPARRHLAHLLVHVRGPQDGRTRDRSPARRALPARGQRAERVAMSGRSEVHVLPVPANRQSQVTSPPAVENALIRRGRRGPNVYCPAGHACDTGQARSMPLPLPSWGVTGERQDRRHQTTRSCRRYAGTGGNVR